MKQLSNPDLQPLLGVRVDASNDPQKAVSAEQARSIDLSQIFPQAEKTRAISENEAWQLCEPFVGLTCCRPRPLRIPDDSFDYAISAWWDRLRSTQIPEERLTAERMINALNIAKGMDQHMRGAELAIQNVERVTTERRVAAETRREAEEAECVAVWRRFNPCA